MLVRQPKGHPLGDLAFRPNRDLVGPLGVIKHGHDVGECSWDRLLGVSQRAIQADGDQSRVVAESDLGDRQRAGSSGPWGSETQIRSRRGRVVLVDEPTEQVTPANIAR